MKYPIALLMIPICEWCFYYQFSESVDLLWHGLLFSKHVALAVAVQAAYVMSKKHALRVRATFAFLACVTWCDVPAYVIWYLHGVEVPELAPGAVLFMFWCAGIASRSYPTGRDYVVSHDNVMILFLKPRGFLGIVKSFIGSPVESVCILTGKQVWSFRRSRREFCKSRFSNRWLESHIVVDTGVKVNDHVVDMLSGLIGLKRGVGVRCVYVIRNVLIAIGKEYKPKTVFHLIPGVYAMQILRGKGCREK